MASTAPSRSESRPKPMNAMGERCSALILSAGLAACAQSVPATNAPPGAIPASQTSSKIQHVVIIFQENRSTDNLFHDFPGADTVDSGRDARGGAVRLRPVGLTAPYDLSHTHAGFLAEYANGKLNAL